MAKIAGVRQVVESLNEGEPYDLQAYFEGLESEVATDRGYPVQFSYLKQEEVFCFVESSNGEVYKTIEGCYLITAFYTKVETED